MIIQKIRVISSLKEKLDKNLMHLLVDALLILSFFKTRQKTCLVEKLLLKDSQTIWLRLDSC
jgi:hypothetical protein